MKKSAVSLSATAIRMLAMREHSRLELRRKLVTKAEAGDDVDVVLDRLVDNGLQSDARFAESFVRSRSKRHGEARIRRELAERGVDAETAQTALEACLQDEEILRARSVWVKKFGEAPQDIKEWARQARFLQARGFAVDVIRKLLKEPFDESAQGQ